MNIQSMLSLAGLALETDSYHSKDTCGCKVCSMYRWSEVVPADRTLYHELQEHKVQKCSKRACKKFGCDCGF